MSADQAKLVPRVLMLGAGQQAKLFLHILREAGVEFEVLGLLDDQEALQGKTVHGHTVLGRLADLGKRATEASHFAIGIGNTGNAATMVLRGDLFNAALEHGLAPLSAIHPRSHIDRSARVGEGSVVHLGACINAFTTLGRNCVLFSNASIDHDSVLGDNVYVSPGVSTGGNLSIRKDAFVGVGASILQGITIGEGAIVGAGAVVIEDVPAHTTVVGVPARAREPDSPS